MQVLYIWYQYVQKWIRERWWQLVFGHMVFISLLAFPAQPYPCEGKENKLSYIKIKNSSKRIIKVQKLTVKSYLQRILAQKTSIQNIWILY